MGTLKLRDQANAAWIALRGPRGLKGATGDQGPQGIQGIQGPAGASGALVLLQTITLNAAATSIDITGLDPNVYGSVILELDAPAKTSASTVDIKLNNDSTSGSYAWSGSLNASGGAVSGFGSAGSAAGYAITSVSATPSVRARIEVSLTTLAFATWISRQNTYTFIGAGERAVALASAVTSIQLLANWNTGTVVRVYGVKK